jgi:two-component system response regulator AtoC
LLVIHPGEAARATRFFRLLSGSFPDVPHLLIASPGDEGAAFDALRAGVDDVLVEPVSPDALRLAVERQLARRSPEELPSPPSAPSALYFGTSIAMREIQKRVARVAPSLATVLVRGESGTGKEKIATEIHRLGPRADRPMVRVHCAALAESLLESELFGHEKGAFTGATARKPGRFELADGGTLFLDEIGEIPLSTQVKLLRVLQERTFERVGGTETLTVDVRILAATHRNLEEMIQQRQFREDLYYRLNVIPLWLPPLRARREDIPALAQLFCATLAAHHGKPGLVFSPEALSLLRRERWPGNVRQLQNVVERLVVLSTSSTLTADDIREDLGRSEAFATQAPTLTGSFSVEHPGTASLDTITAESERQAILAALARASGNKTLAARLLGISRRTLYYKLEALGLS